MHGLEKPMDHVSGNDLSMYLGIGKKHQCRQMFQDLKYFFGKCKNDTTIADTFSA